MNIHCPKCGSDDRYIFRRRKVMRCKDCGSTYSATSGTRFASSKLSESTRITLINLIELYPTMSAQKIADVTGVSLRTAWLWKVRVLAPYDNAAKGYYQGIRNPRGMTKSIWPIRHVDPWPPNRQETFLSMWKRGCPIKCMAAMFGVQPGTISSRAIRYNLMSRRAA